MIPLRNLKNSDDQRVLDGFVMDEITRETMKALNLKFMRSSKNRDTDRKKAIARFGKTVNLKDYAIHHCYNGLVGLAPIEIHKSINHRGYFYRLKYAEC